MELKIAPAFLCAILGLLALFMVYKALPGGELTCSSVERGDPWMVEASVIINNKEASFLPTTLHRGENRETSPEKSIAQFLQEKIDRGGLSRYEAEESDELAGLDSSTRALLAELVRSLSSRSSSSAPDQEKDWGLLNFDYGLKRVVKRLVVCSAYRTSLREFTVITLSPDFTLPTSNPDFKHLPPKDPAVKRTCTWLEDGNAGAPFFGSEREMNRTGRTMLSNGKTAFKWIGETHGTSYDVMLIHCTFPEPVGTALNGGYLYLNFIHGDSRDSSAPTELAPVYHERPEALNASMYEASSEFQFEFAYCSGPVFTTLTPSHVKQFLMYHYALLDGAVHFFLYDSHGIDPETMAVLQPLIDAGTVTLVNFRKESQYDTWYHSQDLAINDCLYRTRNIARWVLSWDMDEYLHLHPPLRALLEQVQVAPWVSFGKIDFSLSHCAPNSSMTEWAVERMVYRQEKATGARKWMANPRKVKAGRIHAISDSPKGGVVLGTNVAIMNHYRGLVAPRGRFNCEEVVDPSVSNSTLNGKTLLWSDLELASLVTSTLKSSVENLPMFKGRGTS
ncbi:unnamed protein product [Calypogeia fissa]